MGLWEAPAAEGVCTSAGSVIIPLSTIMALGMLGTAGTVEASDAVRRVAVDPGVTERRLLWPGVFMTESSSLPSSSLSSANKLCCGMPLGPEKLPLGLVAGLLCREGPSLNCLERRDMVLRLDRNRIM